MASNATRITQLDGGFNWASITTPITVTVFWGHSGGTLIYGAEASGGVGSISFAPVSGGWSYTWSTGISGVVEANFLRVVWDAAVGLTSARAVATGLLALAAHVAV